MSIGEILGEVEATGIALRLDRGKVRIWYPEPQQRERLASQVAFLRAHRSEVAEFLQARDTVPVMPSGVRLVSWSPKHPPIVLSRYSVVTDVTAFIASTLTQLEEALKGNGWRAGHWSVRELVERLEETGVKLEVTER